MGLLLQGLPMPADPRPPRLPLRASDLRGLALLGRDGVVGVTDLVEQMHLTILRLPGPVGAEPVGRTRGITGLVYRSVRSITGLVGWSLDGALRAASAFSGPDAQHTSSPEREALLAALNGVWGDHLVASSNPLAIPMAFRAGGIPLVLDPAILHAQLAAPAGRLLVLAHGLCMNDLQWQRQGHDHGQALAASSGYTPVYLHYNSGRHISDNGRDFAALLGQLVAAWPVPVLEIVLLGHSMGGLVARSACLTAQQQGLAWLGKLSRIACLGTPHHGAALERGGRLVDRALGISPYAAPFARLGGTRSAGITDLRFGNVQEADWQGHEAGNLGRDQRQPAPLPAGVAVFAVAGQLKAPGTASRWVGDGLVSVDSALGRHADPGLALGLPQENLLVVEQADHFDLLNRPEVTARLQQWLAT
jgi:hypothetical protein